ncbi:hypothetical protein Lfu02_80080 [Longispora fulva]|uniref:Uncharacterized protein n=1 Tax=Longispora fulva TaxID=619741 RepID=A0A8J7GP57_9ACTN|nr:hypothetical protein [Longispora fulva]MBG6140678.1 hypothetical protein [Longispora fulva]GIG63636.1 hypothetical protein Lfu02_80080 [Longispora fulva]
MTSPEPAPSGPTRVELLAALRAGRFAGRRGLGLNKCPYNPAGDGRDRIVARRWVGAYLAEHPHDPGVVDYDA